MTYSAEMIAIIVQLYLTNKLMAMITMNESVSVGLILHSRFKDQMQRFLHKIS